MTEPIEVLEARRVIAQYEVDKVRGLFCLNCGHAENVHFSQGCRDGYCEKNCFNFVKGTITIATDCEDGMTWPDICTKVARVLSDAGQYDLRVAFVRRTYNIQPDT